MRLLFALLLILPVPAFAGLLDLLPLAKIERKMIYPLSAEYVHPSRIGLSKTIEHRVSRDGETLIVWSLPAKGKSRATVLYFHGNAGNLAARSERFKLMQAQGFNILAMSYRGSSGSSGVPSEPAIIKDALHIYQNARELIDVRSPKDLILYGESLGSAVAIALLASLEKKDRPSGVILEAPFTSTPDMARTISDLPDSLISRISDTWDSHARASALTVPSLIIHGTADEVTPLSMGRTLFQAIATQDKDFIAVKGASHSGTWRSDTTPKLWRFINAYGSP